MNQLPGEPGRVSLRDALRVVGRWKWLILAFVVVMTGAAFAFSITRTPAYTATAELKYEPPMDISNPFGTSSRVDPQQANVELQSVESEINGQAVKVRAAAELNLSPADERLKVSTAVPPNTTVVSISAVSDTPTKAAAVANAFAAGFIANNQKIAQDRLAQVIQVVQEKLRAYTIGSPDHTLLSQRLSDLQIAEATVAGDFRLISVAVPPTSQSSPQPARDTALGFVTGLLSGIAVALVLEQLSTRLRSRHEVSELLGLPVVSSVPKFAKRSLAESPLVVLHEPWGNAADSFRVLRNYLDTRARDEGLTTVLVTSCQSGEGTSVTISNLALAVAMGGKRVVLIDANLRQPSVHRFFSLDNELGLSTVVSGQTSLVDALKSVELPLGGGSLPASPPGNGTNTEIQQKRIPNLRVLTSGAMPQSPDEIVASRRFDVILKELRASTVDFILIDSPALLAVSDAATMAARVEAVLLVVNMETATRPVLAEARESLDNLACRTLGVVAVRQH